MEDIGNEVVKKVNNSEGRKIVPKKKESNGGKEVPHVISPSSVFPLCITPQPPSPTHRHGSLRYKDKGGHC